MMAMLHVTLVLVALAITHVAGFIRGTVKASI